MKRILQTLTLATALISVVATTAKAEEPKKGGTLVVAIQQTPRHLNPAVQSGTATGAPGAQLFAAPLRYDEDWTPQPYLAESWKLSDDGLSMTLNLVKNATFHDGKPITSEDVAFSVDVIKANHPFKTMFAPVTNVETPDAHTAILKLSQPHPALMLAMSSQLMPIIPKHVYGDGQDPKAHPQNSENVVGSGPFKLVEFKRDQHIILERYDGFFMKDRPYLDKISMRIIKDASARTIGLENGELHMVAFENNVRNINRLKKSANLTATPDGYAAIGPVDWLAFNTKVGKTADVKVRQAIAYAVDKNFILKAIMLGAAQQANGPIHPGSPLNDEASLKAYDLDVDKANALLDEAGYAKGADGMRFPLTIDYGWPAVKPQVEYVKAALKKIGIDVTVRASADFPTWAKRVGGHDFDMTWDTVFNWGDPVIGVHRTYQSSNIKKGVIWSNTQQYENSRVDELLEQAGKESDPAKRKALYAEFQKIVAEELPVYWTNTLPYHTIYNNKVGNAPKGIWATSSPMDRVYLK
ncbi:MAG: ABC transporter substrate-binding protein [Pseudomonadota bacterium]